MCFGGCFHNNWYYIRGAMVGSSFWLLHRWMLEVQVDSPTRLAWILHRKVLAQVMSWFTNPSDRTCTIFIHTSIDSIPVTPVIFTNLPLATSCQHKEMPTGRWYWNLPLVSWYSRLWGTWKHFEWYKWQSHREMIWYFGTYLRTIFEDHIWGTFNSPKKNGNLME